MTTGYTHSQIQEFIDAAASNAPPHPTHRDLQTAPVLSRVAMVGTDVGAAVRIALKERSKPVTFFLNPYIAVELIIGLNEAGINFKWWDKQDASKAKPLPELQREDVETALRVVSITTASEPNGLLIRFAAGDPFTFYLPRKFAAEFAMMLKRIGDTATWWDENFVLLPKPN